MTDGDLSDALPLTRLELGESARIIRISGGDSLRLVKLSSLGLVPGTVVCLRQRRPTAVIQVAETVVALDGDIAAEIWVTRQG